MDLLNLSTTTNFSILGRPPPPPLFLWGSRTVAPVALLSLCFLVGFPGNLAVVILKPNWQNLSTLSQSLMMNLAVSDLLCLATLPLWVYSMLFNWTLGTAICKIVAFFTKCSVYSSLLTVTALSIQRYMQANQQHSCLRFKKRLLVLLWLTSMALSIPPLVFRQIVKDQQRNTCGQRFTSSMQHVAVLLTECVVGFGTLFILTLAYIFLNRKLNKAVLFNNPSISHLVTSIIVTFFVLWMPYLLFNLVTVGGLIKNDSRIVDFYDTGLNIFGSIISINSCINPLLYAFALRMCHKKANLSSNNRELTSVTDL